jgi:mannose-6-phosphate isomerase
LSHTLQEFVSPLWFRPVFRQYLWGGRRLGDVLGKPIGPDGRFAESWEVVDHGADQSTVEWGWLGSESLAGVTLGALMQDHGSSLIGPKWFAEIHSDRYPANLQGRFPLLVKWLDAQQNLSLQVHPNNDQAAQQTPPDLGKSEAWYVADAAPGARVYAGLLPGVGQAECEAAIRDGRLKEVLYSYCPEVGDCIYIPAGTIHAIGAGLLVAEVQQASDTTYRLYDWDRIGDNGLPRPLQVAQALSVADWQRGPVPPVSASTVSVEHRLSPGSTATCETLVQCPYFTLQRLTLNGRLRLSENQCQILIGLHGNGRLVPITGGGSQVAAGNLADTLREIADRPLQLGSSVLVPYGAAPMELVSDGGLRILVATLPE